MHHQQLPSIRPKRTRSCQQKEKPAPLRVVPILWHASDNPLCLVEFGMMKRVDKGNGQVDIVPDGNAWMLEHRWCKECHALLPGDSLPKCFGTTFEGKTTEFITALAKVEAHNINHNFVPLIKAFEAQGR